MPSSHVVLLIGAAPTLPACTVARQAGPPLPPPSTSRRGKRYTITARDHTVTPGHRGATIPSGKRDRVTGHDLLRDGKPPSDWPLDRPPLLLETSLPGVFAAGDVRHGSVKRVAWAVGEGAIAIQLVHQYLGEALPVGR